MKGRIETLFAILQIEKRWYNQCDWNSNISNTYKSLIENEMNKSVEYFEK